MPGHTPSQPFPPCRSLRSLPPAYPHLPRKLSGVSVYSGGTKGPLLGVTEGDSPVGDIPGFVADLLVLYAPTSSPPLCPRHGRMTCFAVSCFRPRRSCLVLVVHFCLLGLSFRGGHTPDRWGSCFPPVPPLPHLGTHRPSSGAACCVLISPPPLRARRRITPPLGRGARMCPTCMSADYRTLLVSDYFSLGRPARPDLRAGTRASNIFRAVGPRPLLFGGVRYSRTGSCCASFTTCACGTLCPPCAKSNDW